MAGVVVVGRVLLLGVAALLLFIMATLTSAGVPMTHYEAVMLQQMPTETGLYNASDKVNVLTAASFNSVVLAQNRSVLVEFYNSYCGHCKRFAPYYKELAEQLHPWRDVLLVTAIDCAVEENNGICREYEIMAYPTLRYFSPGFRPAEKSYGHDVQAQLVDELRTTLAQLVAAENRSLISNSHWPDMQPLAEGDVRAPFNGLAEHVQLVIGVYDADNTSTMAIESILHFVQWPDVSIRRIADANVAAAFSIDGTKYRLVAIDRGELLTPYTIANANNANASRSAIETIESILNAYNLHKRKPSPNYISTTIRSNAVDGGALLIANEAIIAEVQRNRHTVYQADLEMAVRVILFNEVPKSSNISDDRLLLLRRFIKLLNDFNPLDANGKVFISRLNDYVHKANQNITAKDFEVELHRLERELHPVFTPSVGYVGCAASRPGLRGYTCALWTLFHYFTVHAATTDKVVVIDPQEVLRVVYGYVKFFFGCTECAEHFKELAERERIWLESSRDGALLWMWKAHNDVNKRLAGDDTEDPQFAKRQFPTIDSCPACYKSPPPPAGGSAADGGDAAAVEIAWNLDAVLTFLKDIYSSGKISRFGLNEELLQRAIANNLRQKRTIGVSVFSDMDMRMGMLLYGFCIVMMIVAFKLFVFKGYRKKPYSHDMLGKV